VESVHIEFGDILAAVEVFPDITMSGEAPWAWEDGYVHTTERVSRLDESRDTADQRRGYCYSDGYRDYIVLTMGWDTDLYRWYRAEGASKQVAREMVAVSLCKRLDRLVEWYEHGWEWWYCGGEYNGCDDGVGIIDDYHYAHDEVRRECAENIAHQLEQTGYIVVNKPKPDPVDTRQQKRDRFRRNRTLFSWSD
jgi:hypothetical protein